jgi:hypothetical protein
MTENSPAMVVKPNLSSERRPRPLRRSPSDSNALSAKEEESSLSVEPRASF